MATILLAEDDPGVREIVKIVVERLGHRVIEADSGPATWDALHREKPELLLLDIMLPGMDGHTLLLRLSQDPALRDVPVLVISALGYAQDMFGKFPQVRDFLTKPFKPLALEEAVGRWVSAVKL